MKIKTLILDKPGEKELFVPFTKEGEEVEVWGLIRGEQAGDYSVKVRVEHKVGKGAVRIVIRGIAKNGARVRVEGMIKIEKNAQEVDDFLEMRILLLDSKSQATAEPKLEIEANQVKASHAAVVGRIDKEQMFYLMSRGLKEKQAEKLIVDGFLGEVLLKCSEAEIYD
ncbi:SufD family Fe-S cluster assembly protein [Candidatus Collierbacteria bacterium]|nr:SufD family Fe-S cluster assembly protein [Candidatus Collierbacteria bacterium]